MNSCKYEQLAYLYPAGALTPKESAEFEEHILTCKSCRVIASDIEGIRGMAAAIGTHATPAGLNERIMNGIKFREQKSAPGIQWAFIQRWQRALAPAALAACLLLLLGVFFTSPHMVSPSHSVARTQNAAMADTGKPSEIFARNSLDAKDQKYLADDSKAALSHYFNNLVRTN
jgi:hypothetical protein